MKRSVEEKLSAYLKLCPKINTMEPFLVQNAKIFCIPKLFVSVSIPMYCASIILTIAIHHIHLACALVQ